MLEAILKESRNNLIQGLYEDGISISLFKKSFNFKFGSKILEEQKDFIEMIAYQKIKNEKIIEGKIYPKQNVFVLKIEFNVKGYTVELELHLGLDQIEGEIVSLLAH